MRKLQEKNTRLQEAFKFVLRGIQTADTSKHVEGKILTFDIVMGWQYLIIVDSANVKFSIIKDEETFILMDIHVKANADNHTTLRGSGLGTQLVHLLKKYADRSKKTYYVFDATKPAKPYWDSIPFLTRDYEKTVWLDGEDYLPDYAYIYKP